MNFKSYLKYYPVVNADQSIHVLILCIFSWETIRKSDEKDK